MTIHSRVLERRRQVAETQARSSLRRLVKLLVVFVPLAVIAWLAFSPYLSVSAVTVSGAEMAEVGQVMAEYRIAEGTPMILIRADQAEAALEADPWVADAAVGLHWPDAVSVSIRERVPLAWVRTAGGWTRRAADGVALPSPDQPSPGLAVVELASVGEGEAASSDLVSGALEFVAALPPRLRGAVEVTERGGELWAETAGHRIRLGRPVEMKAKAFSLATLLTEPLPPGSEINLMAPTHPALVPAADSKDQQP